MCICDSVGESVSITTMGEFLATLVISRRAFDLKNKDEPKNVLEPPVLMAT